MAMATSSVGIAASSRAVGSSLTAIAPPMPPTKATVAMGKASRQSMRRAWAKVQVADAAPTAPCTLLVATALTGSKPKTSKAGTVMRPPPPAMASTQPAAMARAAKPASRPASSPFTVATPY